MLHLEDVAKTYQVGTFSQAALDGVTITFRDNEFVAILGPSGSGKTTLLNIVGGLDHADSGDLAIDQVSTKNYRDRDWDTYRNNRIGFVFQSYNLIPHQTVLANVELALTLSGVGLAERQTRARAALEQVGLTEHADKLPNQLSGGQAQRVAIARALINDPEIVLADEPTGALDSTTGTQVMGLLQEIARDRLVVMVTHNPELASEYATRIVSLKDGLVVGDTNPFESARRPRAAKPARRTGMSFFTAIALSFKNLMSKKGRTLMTSFAGSIGIIGIATILALANGVDSYIRGVEEDTLSLYPLTIATQGIDLASLLAAGSSGPGNSSGTPDGSAHEVSRLTRMFAQIGTNDLASLKSFLDSEGSTIHTYANSIEYHYDLTPQIFAADTRDGVRQVNPNAVFAPLGMTEDTSSMASRFSMGMTADVFACLPDDLDMAKTQYDVVAGRWPRGPGEALLVLSQSGGVPDLVLYAMGLLDPDVLTQMVQDLAQAKPITVPAGSATFTYEELMSASFRVVPASAFYGYDHTYNVWSDRRDNTAWMQAAVAEGLPLTVVGVVIPDPNANATMLSSGLYYSPELVHDLMAEAADAAIVRQQLDAPERNVFSGESFAEERKNPALSDFDFSSLINVDPEALADLFTFDPANLNLDFSQVIDPDALAQSLQGLSFPPPDLTAMLAGLNLQVSPDALTDLLTQTLADFLQATYGDVIETITQPPPTPSATPTPDIPTALPTEFPTELPTDWSTALPTELPTDWPTALPTALPTDWPTALPTALPTDIQIPTLDDLTTSFSTWFATPAVQATFMARLSQVINLDQIESQLSTALTSYMQQTMQTAMTAMMGSLQTQLALGLQATMEQMSSQLSAAMRIDPAELTSVFSFNLDPEQLTTVLMSMMTTQSNSQASNLRLLGYADPATPSSINIYPVDFAAKQQVVGILDAYNAAMATSDQEDKVITYTDIVGTLMNSVTDIVDKISAVLVAFVSISLVVSSIMIGVITYISVLERRKEIGILRAMGASKRNIGNVFNAETLIVGFVAGLMGVMITVGLTLIANPIIEHLFAIDRVARLPLTAALALIGISMALTLLAGLIPSSAASRRDPVEALRSE